MNEPMAKRTAVTPSRGRRGSSVKRPPAATATRHWTKKAATTPTHTGSGRKRVASTRVATMVLSGSSAGKITMKVLSRTTTSIAVEPFDVYGGVAGHATAAASCPSQQPYRAGPADLGRPREIARAMSPGQACLMCSGLCRGEDGLNRSSQDRCCRRDIVILRLCVDDLTI